MANTYSDAELENMMSDIESDLTERKHSLTGKASESLREAVCAFANDLPNHGRAGVVFVGVDDDGEPVGLAITDAMLRRLADVKSDGNIVPPPTLTVQKRILKGQAVAVIVVQPSDSPPVRYRGRICIRIGPRRDIATAQDERVLNERRRYQDPHFDARPVFRARIDDLDIRHFNEEYLRSAFDAEVLAANDRTTPEQLAATKMVVSADDPYPTVAGVLALARRPQDFLPGAYVQFLRLSGSELTDEIVDEALCDGPIGQIIRRLDEKLRAHNRTQIDIRSGPREQRRATYPMVALQQLTRNAVLHRTYEGTNAPVRVYWYSDRIEIISPGGAYGVVTAETFGKPGLADYRNPNLADAMRVLGFIQRFGYGISEARRALHDAELPEPEFEVAANWVSCVIRSRA